MIVDLYILVVPGWDRPFVSTREPSQAFQQTADGKLFVAQVELPAFHKIDGVISVVATPANQPGIRLPSSAD